MPMAFLGGRDASFRERWVNVYAGGHMGSPHYSREEAAAAGKRRSGDYAPVYRLHVRFNGPARTRPNQAHGILQRKLATFPVETV